MDKKVLLMILDGWGIGKHDKSNAIYNAGEPNIDALAAKYPHSQLQACGENVGLPDGQMGNSEVGHLNIGAGRIVYQDLVKINKACQNRALLENREIKGVYDYVKSSGKALHFMGLVLLSICLRFLKWQKSMVLKGFTYIVSWTDATPTLKAAKALSDSWSRNFRRQGERLHP